MRPLVTVVVPIYNVEKYLRKFLDTLIDQTYKNLEILLVNDGSPDGSLQICQEYMQKDSRIKIINKENGGLSDARNAGLEEAQGEYITFLDSDDYVELDMLQEMVAKITEEEGDLVVCGFYNETLDRDENILSQKIAKIDLEDTGSLINILGYAWNKLYRRDFLNRNNLVFQKGLSLVEDVVFNGKVIENNPKIVYVNKAYYHYINRQRPSLIKQYHQNSYELQKLGFNSRKKIIQKFFLKGEKSLSSISEQYLVGIRYCFSNMFYYKNRLTFWEKYTNVREILKDEDTRREIKYYRPQKESDRIIKFFIENNLPLILSFFYFLRSKKLKQNF